MAVAEWLGRAVKATRLLAPACFTPDSYGYTHLIDPEFINANARSLLQRAREAQLAHAPQGRGIRFKLVTNWRLDRNDPLREMIGNRSGAMRLERLYGSSTCGF